MASQDRLRPKEYGPFIVFIIMFIVFIGGFIFVFFWPVEKALIIETRPGGIITYQSEVSLSLEGPTEIQTFGSPYSPSLVARGLSDSAFYEMAYHNGEKIGDTIKLTPFLRHRTKIPE